MIINFLIRQSFLGMISMVNVFGVKMSKSEFLKYFGDLSQYATAIPVVLDYGTATGVKATFIKTGTGLEYTVLPGRALDIAHASYKGFSLGWISKTNIVNPKYYEADGKKWLRSFYGGLLTTCGLTYMGAPCVDNGEALGLHGRISNAEAYDISVKNDWIEDDLIVSVSGKVREAMVFGENLVMSRKISSKAGTSEILIETSVENFGFEPQPLMLLLHVNFGFPLVSPDSTIYGIIKNISPRDEIAARDDGMANFNNFHQPTHLYQEKVFFIEFGSNKAGDTELLLYNKKLQLGVSERFNLKQFPYFTMWKQMGEGDYVLGLEPGTAYPLGRDKIRERGELITIKPGEIKQFTLNLAVIEGLEAIEKEKTFIDKLV